MKDSRTNKPFWINGNNSNCKYRFDVPRFGFVLLTEILLLLLLLLLLIALALIFAFCKSLIFESYNLLHDGAKSPYDCNDCKINKAGSVTSRSSNGGSAARRQFPHI